MSNADGIWGLIPAAGAGLRMGSAKPKQYLLIRGRPVILHTLERLCHYPRLSGVMVGIPVEDRYWQAHEIEAERLPKFLGTYPGGATRAQTVLNGLKALAAHARDGDWVLVHDAVRPCVRLSDIDALVNAVESGKDGGLLALPVADTVKRANKENQVAETIPREGLWRALTPQMFRIGTLRAALEKSLSRSPEITDEAAAIEAVGGHPILVKGHADNIKITLPDDLALAELFLKQQEKNSE
ncbi:MAG TPA: 2-C-methyl-D-erythritol 4-phosphate cytidylyltransferase [Burkholderiales bacterium]|nr:2-C-methyl-D-erythritol 4-phosphate cytidylyltransferase [Burkholderiales bacterium]